MCGIAGIINFAGKPIHPTRLAAADQALARRGPDDRGSWTGNLGQATVALIHRRLAIIDLRPEAAQPMWDSAGRLAVVFNGEIYNFQELRQDLCDRFSFRTHCDTEAILAAWQAWGPKAWDHLAGMWGLAILDLRRQELYLSRDRFGIKPLWYARTAEELVFASELPALLKILDRPVELNPGGLAEYLSLGMTLSPGTLLQGVRKLPPGWMLRADPAGQIQTQEWYTPAPAATDVGIDPADFGRSVEQFRSVMAQVVSQHLVADVPVGVLLSGGIDSSIVAAAAVRDRTSHVRTFSVGFADQPTYDEGAYAAAVAQHLGCDHTALQLDLAQIHAELVQLLDDLDEPFGDSSYLPTALLSQITRKHVTVALSGDGGDELFAGYWRYRGHDAWRKIRFVPRLLRKAVLNLAGLLPSGRVSGWPNKVRQARKFLAADSHDPILRHLVWARIAGEPEVQSLVADSAAASWAPRHIEQTYRQHVDCLAPLLADREPLSAILAADLFTLLPDDMLHKVDRASMRVALEVRVPLLDHRVAEFALGLPLAYKLHDGMSKRLLRAAFAQDLPGFVFNRPKQGFEVPVAEFFRGPWYAMTRDMLAGRSLERCGVSGQAAVSLLDSHRTGRHDHSQILFALLTLAWWSSRNLPTGGGTG